MATLTNTKIKDTYDGLLKTTDNDVIGASEKNITDGLGNASVLSIGTGSASFSSDIEVNTLTIGLGSGSIATNTAIGLDALLSNTSGSGNVSVGQGSLRSNTLGLNNVSVGKDSLRLNTTGSNNTSVGYISLYSNTTGGNNTAIGSGALTDNTTGGSNVAMGKDALNSNTIGSNITAIGRASMSNATSGNNNTALGFYSLVENEASNNVAVGDFALRYNTTGGFNTALGSGSLRSNTTASNNIAIGYRSLYNTTTGGLNIALGNNALDLNTTGLYNVAVGNSALYANETSGSNTALGYRALRDTTGASNTAIGSGAGDTNTTGSNNIYIGYDAVGSAATNDNEIVIGASTTGNGSNTATYGNGSITSHHFTAGQVNVTGNLAVDTNTLYVDAANNSVGIGVSNPADYAFTNLVVGSTSSDGGVTIVSGTSSVSRLLFADGSAAPNEYIGSIQYSHSDNSMKLYTNDDEAMRIDSSGNVGIGTSSPEVLFQADLGASGNIAQFEGNSNVHLRIGESGSNMYLNANNGNATIEFQTNGNERMRIDSSGRILIAGNVTPTLTNAKLFISRGDQYGLGMWVASGVSNIISSDDNLALGSGGSERMRITSGGYLKASNSGTYAGVSSSYHELQSDQNGGMLDIRNTSGNPNIMYLAFPNAAPNNTSNYFLYAQDSSAVKCIIYSNGNIVNANNSYGAISDAKLKENVTDASPKLDDLLQVKVRNFNYIGDDKKQLGVVAQELEEVFPSMIDESPDFEEQEVIDEEGNVTKERVDLGTTTKSVKYSVFVPMLIKAIQEQQEIIQSQGDLINDLKARIETLENK